MGHNQHIDPNEVFPSMHKSLYFIKKVVLAGNIDSKILQSSERFFKEKVKPYGVKVSRIRFRTTFSTLSTRCFLTKTIWCKSNGKIMPVKHEE